MSQALPNRPDAAPAAQADAAEPPSAYVAALGLIDRLHRLTLDVIKDELERLGIHEVNCVQALLLFNIGEENLSAGELRGRGFYQGSNVSYNLKKLVESGCLHYERCSNDRRSVKVRLTAKGAQIRAVVAQLHAQNAERLGRSCGLERLNDDLAELERTLRGQIRYIY